MTRRPRQLTASTDKDVPKTYDGKLEPNYYCRGWNAKRKKYCRSRAGFRTQHPGVGRCKRHGGLSISGDSRVTTGEQSQVKGTSLADLVEQELQRKDPLDLSQELATLRALYADFTKRQGDETNHGAAVGLLEATGRMVERIERIRSANAISRPELNRIMHELWRAIDARIADEDIKSAIRDDWMLIHL